MEKRLRLSPIVVLLILVLNIHWAYSREISFLTRKDLFRSGRSEIREDDADPGAGSEDEDMVVYVPISPPAQSSSDSTQKFKFSSDVGVDGMDKDHVVVLLPDEKFPLEDLERIAQVELEKFGSQAASISASLDESEEELSDKIQIQSVGDAPEAPFSIALGTRPPHDILHEPEKGFVEYVQGIQQGFQQDLANLAGNLPNFTYLTSNLPHFTANYAFRPPIVSQGPSSISAGLAMFQNPPGQTISSPPSPKDSDGIVAAENGQVEASDSSPAKVGAPEEGSEKFNPTASTSQNVAPEASPSTDAKTLATPAIESKAEEPVAQVQEEKKIDVSLDDHFAESSNLHFETIIEAANPTLQEELLNVQKNGNLGDFQSKIESLVIQPIMATVLAPQSPLITAMNLTSAVKDPAVAHNASINSLDDIKTTVGPTAAAANETQAEKDSEEAERAPLQSPDKIPELEGELTASYLWQAVQSVLPLNFDENREKGPQEPHIEMIEDIRDPTLLPPAQGNKVAKVAAAAVEALKKPEFESLTAPLKEEVQNLERESALAERREHLEENSDKENPSDATKDTLKKLGAPAEKKEELENLELHISISSEPKPKPEEPEKGILDYVHEVQNEVHHGISMLANGLLPLPVINDHAPVPQEASSMKPLIIISTNKDNLDETNLDSEKKSGEAVPEEEDLSNLNLQITLSSGKTPDDHAHIITKPVEPEEPQKGILGYAQDIKDGIKEGIHNVADALPHFTLIINTTHEGSKEKEDSEKATPRNASADLDKEPAVAAPENESQSASPGTKPLNQTTESEQPGKGILGYVQGWQQGVHNFVNALPLLTLNPPFNTPGTPSSSATVGTHAPPHPHPTRPLHPPGKEEPASDATQIYIVHMQPVSEERDTSNKISVQTETQSSKNGTGEKEFARSEMEQQKNEGVELSEAEIERLDEIAKEIASSEIESFVAPLISKLEESGGNLTEGQLLLSENATIGNLTFSDYNITAVNNTEKFAEEMQALIAAIETEQQLLGLPNLGSLFSGGGTGGGGLLAALQQGGLYAGGHPVNGGGGVGITPLGSGINAASQGFNNFFATLVNKPGKHPSGGEGSSGGTASSSGSSGGSSSAGGSSVHGASGGNSTSGGGSAGTSGGNSTSSSGAVGYSSTGSSGHGGSSAGGGSSGSSSGGFGGGRCIPSRRLCQTLAAIQPCCSGEPCVAFSSSLLNSITMGNLGACS